jgi:Domain of unknown function (DUF4411)
MAYLIDADVLIEAKDRYYGFDFCPGFWDWLRQQNAAGNVFSVYKVGDEIISGNDDLSVWAKAQGAAFFLPADAATAAAMATVSATVLAMRAGNQPYQPAALAKFFAAADYYLIAHALAHGHTVVTNETGHAHGQQPSVNRLKIPNVCAALGVKCSLVFKMLSDCGSKLIV